SVGIEQGSVVTDQEQLRGRVAHVLERYGPPVLVEAFIRGREFHVTLVEEAAFKIEDRGSRIEDREESSFRSSLPGFLDPRSSILDFQSPPLCMLPLAEIVFLDADSASWPIYSYDAKWKTDGWEYQMTPLRSPVELEPDLTDRLGRMAREAFRLVGCR